MSRPRSPKRKKALKMWLESGRTMPLVEVADKIGVSDSLLRKWKFEDNWDEEPDKRSRGGQPGNTNAIGNNGGAPIGNKNGTNPFLKFLPSDPEYLEILEMVRDMEPLDMIYHGIESSFATLIRMEKIMFVESKSEMIKETKKQKFEVHDVGTKEESKPERMLIEEEVEFQWSWDRYMTYVKAFTKTYSELRSGIRQFLSLAPDHDARRLKLDVMQAQIERLKAQTEKIKFKENPKTNKLENLL